MEKIIIVWPKEVLSHMDVILKIIASNAVDILIIDPKDKDYEEKEKEAHNNSNLILNGQILKKFLEEQSNNHKIKEDLKKFKVPKIKDSKPLNTNTIINETPWYNRFSKPTKKKR